MTAEGVSRYPCSQIYCGPEAASEPETRAVQDEARRLVTSESGSRLRGWLTMHAYGRMWMFPYGTHVKHSPDLPCQHASDHDDLVCFGYSINLCNNLF